MEVLRALLCFIHLHTCALHSALASLGCGQGTKPWWLEERPVGDSAYDNVLPLHMNEKVLF